MRHIGIGRAYKNTRLILLVDGLDICVKHQQTGKRVRELALDTTRDHQSPNWQKLPNPGVEKFPMSCDTTYKNRGNPRVSAIFFGRADRI